MLNTNSTSSLGLSRIKTMVAGVSTLLLVAGSAQALSVDLSGYEGGDAQFAAGDHTISISESRGKDFTSISLSFGGAELAVNSISVAVRSGRGVVATAGDATASVSRKSFRDDRILDLVVDTVSGSALIEASGWRSFTLAAIDIDVSSAPVPVTAVPEPGAALLFGAGIMLAGTRRR